MLNIDIGNPVEETVTLSYLKTLPMFGSVDWVNAGWDKMGPRGLFQVGRGSKEELLSFIEEEKKAIIIETLPRANKENTTFRFQGVAVIVDD